MKRSLWKTLLESDWELLLNRTSNMQENGRFTTWKLSRSFSKISERHLHHASLPHGRLSGQPTKNSRLRNFELLLLHIFRGSAHRQSRKSNLSILPLICRNSSQLMNLKSKSMYFTNWDRRLTTRLTLELWMHWKLIVRNFYRWTTDSSKYLQNLNDTLILNCMTTPNSSDYNFFTSQFVILQSLEHFWPHPIKEFREL